MPRVNGHLAGSPALQASSSTSSFEPATTTLGELASIAMAGSFCLFWENGLVELPFVTRTSPPEAEAGAASSKASAAANKMGILRMVSPYATPPMPRPSESNPYRSGPAATPEAGSQAWSRVTAAGMPAGS